MLMFLNRRKKSKAGYTLTELIVVVTILGILAAIATPFVMTYVDDARESTDIANAKIMEDILERAILRGKDADDNTFTESDLATATKVKDAIEAELDEIPTPQQGSTYEFYVDKNTRKVEVKETQGDNDTLIQ